MRQLATADDGTGYEIRPCLVTYPDKTKRRGALLTEDDREVHPSAERHEFASFAEAREEASKRLVDRKVARMPEVAREQWEYRIDWRTE